MAKRVRKLNEHDTTISVALSEREIGAKTTESCDIRNKIDLKKQEIKDLTSAMRAKIAVLASEEKECRRAAATGSIDVTLHVEEWLLDDNSVIRVDQVSGDQVGPSRTARPAELQEDMFPEDDDDGVH